MREVDALDVANQEGAAREEELLHMLVAAVAPEGGAKGGQKGSVEAVKEGAKGGGKGGGGRAAGRGRSAAAIAS